MNIPIFRAKKTDSNEYVIGFYSVAYDIHHYIITYLGANTKVDVVYQSTDIHKINPTTLSISFPDMLDSQGNRIFASLQEDGKGGDILELQASSGTCLSCNTKLEKSIMVAIYEQMEFREIELNHHECFTKREHNCLLKGNIEYKKIIGIQQ